MNIQSISIVVPTKGCINSCKFCVSKMHDSKECYNFNEKEIKKRIKYAVNNKVNTCVITGTGEALENKSFLYRLAEIFEELNHPFPNVELQTTGILLFDSYNATNLNEETVKIHENLAIIKKLQVNTISLSISNIFNSDNNWDIIGAPSKKKELIVDMCKKIKEEGFNLRLSLNMINVYDKYSPQVILAKCKKLGANQVTFRKMYSSDDKTPEGKWVKENACKPRTLELISIYVAGFENDDGFGNGWWEPGKGNPLYKLPFGAVVYSLNGMSLVIDNDCMSKENHNDKLKYIILRENGKLYCRWDDEGSLLF